MKRIIMVLLLVLIPTVALARGRRRGYTYSTSSYSLTVRIDDEKRLYGGAWSLQDIAMIRAGWMARFETMSHSIHHYHKNCPPWPRECSGEGIGCGGPGCGTCVVGSIVVADAEAVGKSGRTYRVRFFKNR